ncbi:L,D-transpeptidase family protein [Pseudolabrys sp.]|uniref:L,D-transpeptidase family protein n=1 Tax=Pseudolabrys sp. TaxID=1960880 RepID=UPI003D0A5A64
MAQTTPAASETTPAATDSAKPAGTTAAPSGDAAAPAATAAPAPSSDKPADAAAAKPAEPAPAQAATPAATDKPVTQTAAPAPAAVDKNAEIAAKLRELVPAKADRLGLRRDERTAVEAFYKARAFAPVWLTDGAVNAKAKSAIDYLAHVDRDGLDPSEYPTPDFAAASGADALADAEMKLTAAALTYSRHALYGRVNYTRVAADISFTQDRPSPEDVLKQLAASDDAAKTLNGFEPQHHAYQALKQALADARAGKHDPKDEPKKEKVVRIPAGKVMKPGMKDERVVLLRKRLKMAEHPDSNVYDNDVQAAVTKFQKDSRIGVDGNVGPATLAALNGEESPAAKIGNPVDMIIANMDRWRWYDRDLGNPRVIVNIPDYRLTVYNDEKVYWTTKIVVGLPGKATPLISADMKFITVNPTWNVPPSIIQNEYLPALQEDPNALDRIGLKVEQAADGTVRIYQPPGAGNALGRIRFNFPNKFLVYQHDTPDKHLFARPRRAYSHGCMRVENPLKYGEVLLSLALPQEHYTAARLEKMFGGSEININFPKHIRVHLTYQTAFVDDEGKLQLREDVYGRDARMLAILKGSERKIADIAIDRPPNTSAKPVRVAPGTFGGGGYSGGPNFFDFLFGGPQPRETYVPPARRRTDNNGRYTSWR